MTQTITQTLSSYAASSSAQAIPAEAKERARQVIFDEIVGAFFARRSLAGDLGARYAALAGGPRESRILATGEKVSAPNAAMANGAAGHGEEVDGAHVIGGHPAASIVHAAVAMAERQRATGAELLNAVVLGYDIGVRIIDACGGLYSVKNRFGLHSDFLYSFGCSAAAGRLLGLDAGRIAHAMALTSFGSIAHCTLFAEKRHISKSLCNGQFAWAGVTGALQSSVGLEGNEDIIGAPFGILANWGAEGRRDATTRALGKEFAIMGANFKFVNAGYPIHAPVEAALALVQKHAITLERIESIYIGMPTDTAKVVDGRAMHNICAQDVVSAALVQGGLKLRESPFPDVLANPAFTRLRPRVTLSGDAELDRDQPAGRGAIVAITTTDGQVVKMRVDHPKGHSLRGGVTWDDLARKWHEGLPECDVDRMLSAFRRIEDLEDVGELLDTVRVRG